MARAMPFSLISVTCWEVVNMHNDDQIGVSDFGGFFTRPAQISPMSFRIFFISHGVSVVFPYLLPLDL